MPEPIRYLILATPRSGSYLLCDGLRQTGRAGAPTEFFGRHQKMLYCAGAELPMLDYVAALLDFAAERSNNIFGAKLMWPHLKQHLLCELAELPELSGFSDQEIIKILFPGVRIIRLSRRDRVRQAVSYARAHLTGVWSALRDSGVDGPPRNLFYDEDLVERCFTELEWEEEGITGFLENSDFRTLDVWYEELAEDYIATLRRVLDFIGVEDSDFLWQPSPRFVKQSDEDSTRWVRLFIQSGVL